MLTINSSIFVFVRCELPESPLWIPGITTFRETSGDVPRRHVLAGTTLIISNDEMDDIKKVVKSLKR